MPSKILKNTISLLAGLHAANTLINYHADNLAKMQNVTGNYYEWRLGKIFYRVRGRGEPVLLIHDLDHRSASYEWEQIFYALSTSRRVYMIDLPGCGRSDKPKSIYTAYLFVQAIRDFCTNVIKGNPTVIASKDSCDSVLMVNGLNKSLLKKVILINPSAPDNKPMESDIIRQAYLKVLFTPVIGRSVYNFRNFSSFIFLSKALVSKIDNRTIINSENEYVASHLQKSNGRFLMASKLNRYINVNTKKQIQDMDNICVVFSAGLKDAKKIMLSYMRLNDDITAKIITTDSLCPQRDYPAKTLRVLKDLI